jgi:hypothetical protein
MNEFIALCPSLITRIPLQLLFRYGNFLTSVIYTGRPIEDTEIGLRKKLEVGIAFFFSPYSEIGYHKFHSTVCFYPQTVLTLPKGVHREAQGGFNSRLSFLAIPCVRISADAKICRCDRIFSGSPFKRIETGYFDSRVVCVVDRDTLCVKTNDARCATIRLFGVDCPEGKQEFGDKS